MATRETQNLQPNPIDPGQLRAFGAWLRRKGLQPSTCRVIMARLRTFARWFAGTMGRPLAPGDSTWERFEFYCAENRPSINNIRGIRYALNYFNRWHMARGLLKQNPLDFDPAYLELLRKRGLSKVVARSHHSTARDFASWFIRTKHQSPGPHTVTQRDIESFLGYSRQRRQKSEARVRAMANSILSWLKWAGADVGRAAILHADAEGWRRLEDEVHQANEGIRRLIALRSLAGGEHVSDIARRIGVSRWTVYTWAHKFAEEYPDHVTYAPNKGMNLIKRD